MRTRQRKLRQQGVAYVQALVVALTMIVFFACVLMFARTYDAKIVAGQLARDAAWRAGLAGCPHAFGQAINDTAGLPHASPDSGAQGGVATAFFKLTPKKTASGDTRAAAPNLLGGKNIPFKTVTQFACNEEPDTSGDLLSAAGWMFDFVKDVFAGG